MRIGKWLIMIGITICVVGLMAFFPEYAAKRVDADMLNQVSTYEQEQTETMNQGLSVMDKMQIMTQGMSEGNQTYVMNRTNLDNLNDIDKNLVPQLKQQITELESRKLIPKIDGLLDGQWEYPSVMLNAYTSSQYLGKVLYVWDMEIQISGYGTITVSLDASTYVIYKLFFQDEVGKDEMKTTLTEFLSSDDEVKDMGRYMNAWMQEYMRYLGEEPEKATWTIDAYGYEKEDGVWPIDLEQATGVVASSIGEPYFATYLYVDIQNNCFGFTPNLEYVSVSYESADGMDVDETNIQIEP
ncbi:MAG: hypothetical protein PUC55_11985 [Lachnospiraceae bacterium]|nr:hypothetical protein [Lachnospiraceae bacterium]HCJ08436.1 hypothetical protein [Lachnospiraceae bacterium]